MQYLSPDPIGIAGGFRPQGYVADPNGWVDPYGLAGCPPNPLRPGEGNTGTYGDLIRSGSKGDNITPHHMPSRAQIEQHGVGRDDGVAMNMDQPTPGSGGRHRRTRTYGRSVPGESPRDALARDIMDARRFYMEDGRYTPEIRQSLLEVIRLNKELYSDIFTRGMHGNR